MKIKTMIVNMISKYKAAKDPIGYCRKLGAKVGDNCVLKPSMLGTEPWLITIGNHVLLAEGVRLLTHDGAGWCMADTNPQLRMDMWGKITLGNNIYVGTNAMIMAGVSITDNVIIGAGSIVTKSITEDGVYVGAPVKRIKCFDEWKEDAMKKAVDTSEMTMKERRLFFDKLLTGK